MLGKIANAAIVARRARSSIQLKMTCKNLQKRGLACSIRAHQHRTLALLNLKVEIIINDISAIGLANPIQGHDFLTTTRGLRKSKADRGLVGFRSLDADHATELLDAILCL